MRKGIYNITAKFAVSICLAIFCIDLSHAATVTTTQSGDWADGSTWGGSVPLPTDDVQIKHAITSDADQTVASLGFGTSWGPQTAGTLVVNSGTITVNGNVSFALDGQDDGILTIASGSFFNTTGTITWNQGSTINVNGELDGINFSVTNGNGGNFNVGSTGVATFTGTVTISAGNHSFNIDGEFNAGDVTVTGSAGIDISATGDMNADNVTVDSGGGLVVSGNLDVEEDLTLGNGAGATAITSSGVVTVGGTFTATDATTVDGTVTAGTVEGTVTEDGGTINGSLPVDLLSFRISNTGNTILIQWETASEINNDYFNLQRSKNGIDFEVIEQINGNGNSNQVIQYETYDYPETAGDYYYKLMQVDYDGQNETFDMVKVHFDNQQNNQLLPIYPSQLSKGQRLNVTFTANDDTLIKASLTDLSGRTTVDLKYEYSNNNIELLTENINLRSGIYFLKVQLNLEIYVQKIIVN